jgi:hypothetical protein
MVSKVVDIGGKKPEACMFCDGEHSSLRCLRVEYLSLYEDGSVEEVQFFPPSVWKPE